MPIVNKDRFQAELAQSHDSIQVQALSHAIGTLGALATPELAHGAETCYRQARNLLDMCERQENGTDLNSINTLQTSVLLGFYELTQPNFARAWITLGRATRLAKIMGLERIDGEKIHNDEDHATAFRSPAAPTNHWGSGMVIASSLSPIEAEERRRTLWQLYILDAHTGMRTDWASAFSEVST